jgi:scyllo-inositol 2-dehydrogenase (NADP+)
VALIGYGLAGEVFHAPLIDAVPGLELTAIVTRDDERRRRAAHVHPQAELLDSPEGVWERSDSLELVVIATPNRSHVELALAAIEAGLGVVVDKPLAPHAAGGREVVDAARARGVLLTVFQNRRWDGDFLTVQRLIREDALGRVYRFESRFERWRPALRGGWRESEDAAEAGGLLYDLGSHLIDQALVLFGPVEAVYAELEARRSSARVDDDTFVALMHTSGVRSHLWASAVAALLGPRLRVLGERAGYVKYGLDLQEEQLRAGLTPGSAGFGEEPPERWGVLGAGDETTSVPTTRGAYERFYIGVAASLLSGAPAPVDADDAVAALEVLEAAQRSARERRVAEL